MKQSQGLSKILTVERSWRLTGEMLSAAQTLDSQGFGR